MHIYGSGAHADLSWQPCDSGKSPALPPGSLLASETHGAADVAAFRTLSATGGCTRVLSVLGNGFRDVGSASDRCRRCAYPKPMQQSGEPSSSTQALTLLLLSSGNE